MNGLEIFFLPPGLFLPLFCPGSLLLPERITHTPFLSPERKNVREGEKEGEKGICPLNAHAEKKKEEGKSLALFTIMSSEKESPPATDGRKGLLGNGYHCLLRQCMLFFNKLVSEPLTGISVLMYVTAKQLTQTALQKLESFPIFLQFLLFARTIENTRK